MTGQKLPASEVLGSRKSVRRGKIPLPAKYDVLLQLFGKHFDYHCTGANDASCSAVHLPGFSCYTLMGT